MGMRTIDEQYYVDDNKRMSWKIFSVFPTTIKFYASKWKASRTII